jgi:hypothetical protein
MTYGKAMFVAGINSIYLLQEEARNAQPRFLDGALFLD